MTLFSLYQLEGVDTSLMGYPLFLSLISHSVFHLDTDSQHVYLNKLYETPMLKKGTGERFCSMASPANLISFLFFV